MDEAKEPQAAGGRDRPHLFGRLISAFFSTNSFGSVLLLILLTYVLSVSVHQSWGRSVVLVVQIATVWLALHVAKSRKPVLMVASVLLVLAAFASVANLLGDDSTAVTAAVFIVSGALYFIAPLSILRAIVQDSDVDLETVLGAIDAYLLVGMFFAFAYQATGTVQSPFFQGGIESTVSRSLFFSFSTLTTTGYGNLVPAANPGQSMAVMEMLIGQLFLVTAVAKVINAWRPARWRAERDEPGAPPP